MKYRRFTDDLKGRLGYSGTTCSYDNACLAINGDDGPVLEIICTEDKLQITNKEIGVIPVDGLKIQILNNCGAISLDFPLRNGFRRLWIEDVANYKDCTVAIKQILSECKVVTLVVH